MRHFLSPAWIAGVLTAFTIPVSFAQALQPATTTPLVAGQNTLVGEVTCGFEAGSKRKGRCDARTTGGWCMPLVHVYAGTTAPSSLAPGSFPVQYRPEQCSTAVSVPFSLPSACLQPAVVAFHAEVINTTRSAAETAWAQGLATGNNWSMTISVPCPFDL